MKLMQQRTTISFHRCVANDQQGENISQSILCYYYLTRKQNIMSSQQIAVRLYICPDSSIITRKQSTTYPETDTESSPSIIKPIISIELRV